MEMMTENYCDDCDDVLHAVFDREKFYIGKVGRIRCKCGCVVKPCNECETHDDCGNCPWEDAKITDAMTDEEYLTWEKEHEPSFYEKMKKGDCGEKMKKGDCGSYYKGLIEKMEGKINH